MDLSNKEERPSVSYSTENRYRINPDTVASRVGEKTILVNITTDKIFSLNLTGGRLWELLTDGKALGEIHQIMLQEFDVTAEGLESEIQSLVKSLESESLIMVDNAS